MDQIYEKVMDMEKEINGASEELLLELLADYVMFSNMILNELVRRRLKNVENV